jgi:hypothetical protein
MLHVSYKHDFNIVNPYFRKKLRLHSNGKPIRASFRLVGCANTSSASMKVPVGLTHLRHLSWGLFIPLQCLTAQRLHDACSWYFILFPLFVRPCFICTKDHPFLPISALIKDQIEGYSAAQARCSWDRQRMNHRTLAIWDQS